MDPMKKFLSIISILVVACLFITGCQPGTVTPGPARF